MRNGSGHTSRPEILRQLLLVTVLPQPLLRPVSIPPATPQHCNGLVVDLSYCQSYSESMFNFPSRPGPVKGSAGVERQQLSGAVFGSPSLFARSGSVLERSA